MKCKFLVITIVLTLGTLSQANIPQVFTAPITRPILNEVLSNHDQRIYQLEQRQATYEEYLKNMKSRVDQNTRDIRNHGHSTFSLGVW